MNENIANLLGLLLSDGSVYYDKSKRTYCIQFTNKSQSLRELFKSRMRECFHVTRFYETICKNAVSIRVFSKSVAELLFKYSPTFRTLPCMSFPACNGFSCFPRCRPLLSAGKQYPPCRIHPSVLSNTLFARAFIRGFVSGDGNVYVNRKDGIYIIEITCYHPFLRRQIIDCINFLGIQTRHNTRSVFVSGIVPFSKFMDEIGVMK